MHVYNYIRRYQNGNKAELLKFLQLNKEKWVCRIDIMEEQLHIKSPNSAEDIIQELCLETVEMFNNSIEGLTNTQVNNHYNRRITKTLKRFFETDEETECIVELEDCDTLVLF
jgi:hypothetical protein